MAASLTLTRWSIRRHSDEDVFALAIGGDPVAFSEVYRRYQKPIYGYCLARLMDPQAASDATQEVFIRFLESPRDGIEHPRAWLYAVARNVTIDAIRKRARTPLPTDGEVIEAAVGTSGADAADEYFGNEDAHNVFIALRRLRPRYRTALILRELHHQSSADMADALDTTPGAVDTLVSRARDAFGRTYGEVADLPAECRDAVAAIYKRTGSGLDDGQEARLESHLVACASCKTEMKRAVRLDRLSALLPFLVSGQKAGHNLFERAALSLKTSPELAARLGYSLPAERMTPAVKVAGVILAVGLITAPIVGTVTTRHGGSTSSPASVAASSGQSDEAGAGGQGGAWGPHGSVMWTQDGRWSQSGSWQMPGGWTNMSGVSGGDMWSSSGTQSQQWGPWSNTGNSSSGTMSSSSGSTMSGSSQSGSSGSTGSWSKKSSTSSSSKRRSGSGQTSGTWSSSGSSSGSGSHKSSSWSGSSGSSGSMSEGSSGSGGSMSGGW